MEKAPVPQTYHDLLSIGVNKLYEKNLPEARQPFEQALVHNPQGVEAHYYLGVIDARQGNTHQAKEHFNQAIAIDPTFVPVYFDLGILYYQDGQYTDAQKMFDVVEKVDPARARVYYYQGLIFRQQGKLDKAVKQFEKAAALDAELAPEAHYRAGVAYYHAGNMKAATDALHKVIKMAPESEASRLSHELIEQIQSETKQLSGSLSAGLQYDDNVILEPRAAALPVGTAYINGEDVVSVLHLTGHYQGWVTSKTAGEVRYNLYQNLHSENELKDFDISDHHLNLTGGRETRHGMLTLDYDIQYTFLRDDRYFFQQGMGPTFSFRGSNDRRTDLSYRFRRHHFYNIAPLFPTNADRNVRRHEVGFVHSIKLKDRGHLTGGYFFEKDIAGKSPTQDDWSLHEHRLTSGASLPWRSWTTAIHLEWALKDFAHPNQLLLHDTRRKDRGWFTSVRFARPLYSNIQGSFQYLYQRNNSNIPFYGYRRNLVGVFTTVTF
jgi:tetratricopeptide (TPR) repeat protein